MSDVDEILERLLNSRRFTESATFSSRTYSDQPIIERGRDFRARAERREQRQKSRIEIAQAGSAHRHVPKEIRQMRTLESEFAQTGYGRVDRLSAELFYRQAKLMADYVDDYDFQGELLLFHPTYASMTDHQLRGYFSWRTKVRAGTVPPAPTAFAFTHIYELLMGIGTTPGEQCYEQLTAFGKAYNAANAWSNDLISFNLDRWLTDYAVYHNLEQALIDHGASPLDASVLVLLRAEHALLAAQGIQPRVPNRFVSNEAPDAEELFSALDTAGRYHIAKSRLAKDEHELLVTCASDVFAALVAHCAKRRKTDYVEGMFGYSMTANYRPFATAVFFEETPHPDCVVHVGPVITYVCQDGKWTRQLACAPRTTSKDIGAAMHCLDEELRRQLDYPHQLKERPAPKYLRTLVSEVVTARLKEREEQERRRITIDLSKLASIRSAAHLTQEALLTDEERGEVLEAPIAVPAAPQAQAPEAEVTAVPTPQEASREATPEPLATDAAPSEPDAPFESDLLSDVEARFLAGLMEGRPASELLGSADPFASVVADSINEKLFDLVGDAIIEFDGDEPQIIEDYLEDVREALSP